MDNSVIDLIYRAKQNRIDILWEDDRVQLKAPKNADRNLLNEIKENRESILDFFKENQRPAKKYNKITKAERSSFTFLPLSFSQERLWFIDQLEGSVGYHIPSVLRLTGALNKDALRSALQEIVNRHEVLRTIYKEENGEPRQEVQEEDKWSLAEGKAFDEEDTE
ncbi:MAG: condensation domain-containing protein, partial [Bacteroidota bacterium]|nr:condensation domain-containing protein [Bacteroidota bacterium]